MLKKVILVSTGRYEKSDTLTAAGIADARWLGQQIVQCGFKPQIVFYTGEICSMHTALVLAGIIGSVANHAGLPILGYGVQDRSAQRICFWKEFRAMLRTPETARKYLSKTFQITDSIEEVVVVSRPESGEIFPGELSLVEGLGRL